MDLSVEVLGRYLPVPLGLAPTGFTRMIHPDGERAVAERRLREVFPMRYPPWAPPLLRTWRRRRTATYGSSFTCYGTGK